MLKTPNIHPENYSEKAIQWIDNEARGNAEILRLAHEREGLIDTIVETGAIRGDESYMRYAEVIHEISKLKGNNQD